MKVEIVCRTCGGKRFSKIAGGSSPKQQESWDGFRCLKCKEWITITYTEILRIKYGAYSNR